MPCMLPSYYRGTIEWMQQKLYDAQTPKYLRSGLLQKNLLTPALEENINALAKKEDNFFHVLQKKFNKMKQNSCLVITKAKSD